jgi:hypothetical protein
MQVVGTLLFGVMTVVNLAVLCMVVTSVLRKTRAHH